MKKKKYYRFEPKGLNSVIETLDGVMCQLEDCEVGEEVRIEVVEMTEDEYQNLPEFQGF